MTTKGKAKKRTKPPHRATKERRAQVAALAGFGIRQDEIAAFLEIDPKTLRKHYRRELDTGVTQANTEIARRLYAAAIHEGSVPAMIFWLKARAGWREKHEVTHSGDSNNPIEVNITRRVVMPDGDS